MQTVFPSSLNQHIWHIPFIVCIQKLLIRCCSRMSPCPHDHDDDATHKTIDQQRPHQSHQPGIDGKRDRCALTFTVWAPRAHTKPHRSVEIARCTRAPRKCFTAKRENILYNRRVPGTGIADVWLVLVAQHSLIGSECGVCTPHIIVIFSSRAHFTHSLTRKNTHTHSQTLLKYTLFAYIFAYIELGLRLTVSFRYSSPTVHFARIRSYIPCHFLPNHSMDYSRREEVYRST